MNRIPCTIKFNNYLLIMARGKSSKIIKDYNDLVANLKKWNISPQDTWDLVYKMKLGLDSKTVWKLQRFNHYARFRLYAFAEIAKKKETDPNFKNLKGQDYLIKIKKLLPKRVDTIRKLVNSSFYLPFFNFFNRGKKLDKRKEVKNLEKLIIDKRQDHWFSAEWLDAIGDVEESFRKTGSFVKSEKALKVEHTFDRPFYRDILKILR